jgi:hypothetical protein
MRPLTVETMPKSGDAFRILITRRVPHPAAEVSAYLTEDPARLLGASADHAGLPAGRYPLPLQVSLAGAHFDRVAAVGFASVVEEEDGTRVLPLWWEAADQPWLFPTFDGGLEVRPDDGGTELRLEGRYHPPLGAAGALVNRAILNRAATASLETLLDRLSARLAAARAR